VDADSLHVEGAGGLWSPKVWTENGTLHMCREIRFPREKLEGEAIEELIQTLATARQAEGGYFRLRTTP